MIQTTAAEYFEVSAVDAMFFSRMLGQCVKMWSLVLLSLIHANLGFNVIGKLVTVTAVVMCAVAAEFTHQHYNRGFTMSP